MATMLTLHPGGKTQTEAEVRAICALVRDMRRHADSIPTGSPVRKELLDSATRLTRWADKAMA